LTTSASGVCDRANTTFVAVHYCLYTPLNVRIFGHNLFANIGDSRALITEIVSFAENKLTNFINMLQDNTLFTISKTLMLSMVGESFFTFAF